MKLLLSLLLLVSFQLQGAPLKLPALTSPVMDLGGFLTPDEEMSLARLAYEIHANNGPQITILTVPDLQEYPIEEFSIRVVEKWQLGSKEKDNGLLVLIAKNERQMRIEVGNGIEGEITDYDTARYTRELFPQYFRSGQFHEGLQIFMMEVAQKFNIKIEGAQRIVRRAPRHTSTPGGNLILIAGMIILVVGSVLFQKKPMARGIFTALGFSGISFLMGVALTGLLAFFILGMLLGIVGIGNLLTAIALSGGGRHGGRGGFGGGGFGGGGGWGGGGGGFSGGGSSGSW